MTEKNLLITGGTGGIGEATMRRAVAAGYNVCFSYRTDHARAEALVAELGSGSAKVMAVQADISQEAGVEALFQSFDQAFGRLSGLVNNAAVLDRQVRLDQMSAERINRILTTNVTGSFLCAREAVRRMSSLHGGIGGAIVNVSSAASRIGSPGEYIDYAASKGAIDTLTLGLAKEVAQEGIRVNAVRPGLIHTPMHARGGEPQRVERLATSVPMGRGGEAGEVAACILWLLSEQASYVTGSLLDVSGGR